MQGDYQIILPGLFDLPVDELGGAFLREQMPCLNRVLRFAAPRANRAYTIDAMLARALGLDAWRDDHGLPLAQACADDSAASDRLLLFEAVHLRPDLHSAVLVPIEKNARNLKDIDIIINDLRNLFKVDCDITAVAQGVYLMALKDFAAPVHYPHILSVLGKTANPYMEQSRAHLPWYRLLNEMQMFMHQHAVNSERMRVGQPTLNSLWFWGGGDRLSAPRAGIDWYCDDPLLNRFAKSIGQVVRPLREISTNSRPGIALDLRLLRALKAMRAGELELLLAEIDAQLFAPLLQAATRQRLGLRLRGGFEVDFEMTPMAGYRFWRRQRSLLDWSGRAEAVSE